MENAIYLIQVVYPAEHYSWLNKMEMILSGKGVLSGITVSIYTNQNTRITV